MGDIKGGAFDIPGDLAREWLRLPANPNGRPNADVLKPWANGMDLTRRPSGKWIIDFGDKMSEAEAALYEAPFGYVSERVNPFRQGNREKKSRDFWFRHWNPRPAMWRALGTASRYIATPRVAKHRLFGWLDSRDSAQPIPRDLVAPARDESGRSAALHANHNLRDVPIPARPVAGHSSQRMRCRPAFQGCSPRSSTPGRVARAVAQPARMGRVGR